MSDNTWKKNLWDYLAMAIGFWILKDAKTRTERFGVTILAVAAVILMVFT